MTDWCKITAIVRTTLLEAVEARLREVGVPGVTVTLIKGYGDYRNFFRRDPKVTHVRIEIFLERQRAETVAEAIMETACTGTCGDGLVAIVPVEKIWKIRCRADARSSGL